jgi:hypothetical protein
MRRVLATLLLFPALSFAQSTTASLTQLASDFWAWRAQYRPFTFDDIPRMEHTNGIRDWSAAAVAKQRADLSDFERRWSAMRTNGHSLAQDIDYRLIGSAIARVRWELDINPRWQRDPTFYIEQTVVALQESLLPPPPLEPMRADQVVIRTENIPSILEQSPDKSESCRSLRAISDRLPV